VEDGLRSQNEYFSDLTVKILMFEEKIMIKSHLIKSNYRVLRENNVDNYGAPILHLIIMPIF
jgi:hypothetical protein